MKTLQDAVAGDWVAVRTGGWYHGMEKMQIERATKAMLIVGGTRFNRGGREVGGSVWHGPRIELWDEEAHAEEFRQLREEAEKRRIAHYLRDAKWTELPITVLRDILRAVKDAEPPAKDAR